MTHRKWFRRLGDSSGQTLLEAAFVTPLLLLATFAIIDFATILYVYLALESGVSQATRYGVTGNTMTGMTREQSIRTAMRQATPTLTLPDHMFQFSHLSGGSWANGAGGPGVVEKLTVTYPHDLMVLKPFLSSVLPNGQINLRVESSMRNESRFQ
jgi:hypothetical protein